MNNLESLDAAIVEAAEALVEEWGPAPISWTQPMQQLQQAVQAKREAQRPRCHYYDGLMPHPCGKIAVQQVDVMGDASFRCAEHRVTVTDL